MVNKAAPNAKLTEDQVVRIRGMKGKEDVRDVADWFEVSPSSVRKIWSGETYRNVGRPQKGAIVAKQVVSVDVGMSDEEINRNLARRLKEEGMVVEQGTHHDDGRIPPDLMEGLV